VTEPNRELKVEEEDNEVLLACCSKDISSMYGGVFLFLCFSLSVNGFVLVEGWMLCSALLGVSWVLTAGRVVDQI